jgi:type III restriction enzyme
MARSRKDTPDPASAIDKVPVQAVPDPILCSPYEEPTEHWLYESGVPKRNRGRRSAGYYYKTERTGSAQSELFAEENRDDLPLVNALRKDVARWRESGYRGASEVTKDLLKHWKNDKRRRRLFFCQMEAVETLIYLLELRVPGRSSRTGFRDFELSDGDIARLLIGEAPRQLGVLPGSHHPTLCDQPADPSWMALRRFGCKMATGSGKTLVMAMTIAWAFCNRGRNPASLEFPNAVLVCAPNLTVKSRLGVLRPDATGNYYDEFDLVPEHLRAYLQQGKVLVTNWHIFGLKSPGSEGGVTYRVVDKGAEDEREFTIGRLGELASRTPILVLNDEGHHCWRPKLDGGDDDGASEGETREEKQRIKDELEEARVWLDGLDRINNSGLAGKDEAGQARPGILATIDLSATPFFLAGSGHAEGAPFPWLVSDFGLVDAIESGIVKIPRIPVKQVSPGGGTGPTDDAGRPDPEYFRLWDHMVARMKPTDRSGSAWKPEALYREAQGALATLYSQWKQRFDQYRQAVTNRTTEVVPPAMIVVCPDTATARLFHERISGERTVGAGKEAQTIYDATDFPELKNEPGEIRTFRIDSELLSALSGDEEHSKDERVARMREIIDTIGRPGRPGEHVRCIVSVSMLTEGWDANNVTQILGVRPFRSQLLCEQVVGRGLRRRSYAVRADGKLEPEYVDVYGIPFSLIPFKGREKDSEEKDDTPTNHVHAMEERAEFAIEVPRIENFVYELSDSGIRCDVSKLPDMVLHDEPAAVEVEAVRGYKDDLAATHGVDADIVRQDRQAYYENIHLQRIAFTIAQRVTQQLIDGQNKKKPEDRVSMTAKVFADVFVITQKFIEEKVRLKTGQDQRDLGFEKNLQRAIEALTAGIQLSFSGQNGARIMPVPNRMRPMLRSTDVDEHTKRRVQLIEKSHLNAFSPRSSIEANAARALDWSDHVAAWLPNARGFDLHLAYEHDGRERLYEPDYVVRLQTPENHRRYLIIEVKGAGGEIWDEQAVTAKAAAAKRWCTALNNAGVYGQWDYAILRDVSELDEMLAKAAGVEPERRPFRIVDSTHASRWKTCVPLASLAIAAGGFSGDQESLFDPSAADWVEWNGMPPVEQGMFVARVKGDSMEPKVPAGSWCLFRRYTGGSRNGRDLVVSHQDISEVGFPVGLTLKRYRSERIIDPETGEFRHARIVLEPINPAYEAIEIAEEAGDDGESKVRVVAEFDRVIK